MAGRGTGIPLWFICPVARRNRHWPEPYPPGHKKIIRTGRTRRAPGRGNLPPRKLDTSHEYRCGCGHVGWTCHMGILDYPVALNPRTPCIDPACSFRESWPGHDISLHEWSKRPHATRR